ncbi:predicted GTPase [Candidatus Vecturithrix granuli]|uniref:Predicted GTPase n=1 Tax=Vecturithrix granuli TaxID=1499967 RepID=A0A081C4T7_VECG1|nr:predicted GTPase [Candidatus Vecturithrix granuli]
MVYYCHDLGIIGSTRRIVKEYIVDIEANDLLAPERKGRAWQVGCCILGLVAARPLCPVKQRVRTLTVCLTKGGYMAVDRSRTKELIDGINIAFEIAASPLSETPRKWLKEKIMGSAIGEIERLVLESRPPVLYLLGRSGHGKSSIINALVKKDVAKVSDIKPCTVGADPYFISFPEYYAEWQIIDSRGIFETTTPHGATAKNAVAQVKEDIRKYRPDIILHVVTASECRALEQDFKTFAEIQRIAEKEIGIAVPSIMLINKVDTLGDPLEWPIEKFAKKAGLVKELLDYVIHDVLKCHADKINLNSSMQGYKLSNGSYIGILPVCAYKGREWNIDTLSSFIGEHLPQTALLDFYQALQRKEQLRRLSTSLVRRFSIIAAGIGASPIPIADIAVLAPLQSLLIALIAGLSCRKFSLDSAAEYATASGINVGAAFGFRRIVQQLTKLIPVVGSGASASIAGAGTYGIGKAAEVYFFTGQIKKPISFLREWIFNRR